MFIPPQKPPADKGVQDEVLKRYAEERKKRLKSPRLYRAAAPLREHTQSRRPPKTDHVTMAIIGAGFAGLTTYARLREAGLTSIRVIEKGRDVGGTWYWNRYPGAQCDTAAMVYLPLLEEVGHIPTEKYAHRPEIFAHCQNIARHYGLYQNVLFETGVTSLEWDEVKCVWRVLTDQNDAFTAQFITLALGQFHQPRLPAIEGLDKFKGHMFHTAQWDFAYTGGSPEGQPMTGLADKRVGIVGTGATAVQCVPHLAKSAKQLFVFQRTPSAVDVRNNAPIDPDWFQGVARSGWQQRWRNNFVASRNPNNDVVDLVADGWTAIAQRVRDKLNGLPPDQRTKDHLAQLQSKADLENMARIRRRVSETVQDPAISEGLKAWYFQFCKRPCFHDDYLKAFNTANTKLVDTQGAGIERLTTDGVVALGSEYKVDCIIFASGFDADPADHFSTQITVRGRNAETLDSHWAQGMRSYHGIHVHGFPNAFHVQPTQGANLLSNIAHNLVESAATIATIVCHAVTNGAQVVEATQTAQDDWVKLLLSAKPRVGSDACTPGNFNNEGRPDSLRFLLKVGHPDGPAAFFQYIEKWRSDGRFAGLEFRNFCADDQRNQSRKGISHEASFL